MRLTVRPILTIALALVVAACGDQQASVAQHQNENPEFIVAVNTPLQYFAQRLLGNDTEIRMLAPPGTDPAQWQPSIDDVLQLQQAQLILLNGAGYSSWLNKVSISESRLVDSSSAAKDQWIELEGEVSHSHGPQGEHAHSGYAFTTWMDMSLAQVQARSVAAALSQQWPGKSATIDKNLAALIADLTTLDKRLMDAAAQQQGRQLVYSHPVYQYFERRYQLPGTSLHWEPDLMPEKAQWETLARLTNESTLFVWEAEPMPAIVEQMRESGIEFVVLDPAANTQQEDWLTVQQQNIVRLTELR